MIKNKLVLISAIVIIALQLFTGCGIPKNEYDRATAQLRDSQSQVAALQNEVRTSQAQLTESKNEVIKLREQYELAGKTPNETAEKIVKRYYETHVYTEPDFYVCSDMALDVWDMLKAQGLNAVIQVGRVDRAAKDMSDVDHAWVLAEISPGKYLALETTGGFAVWDNNLYYKGWSFNNPKEYKRFVELKRELFVRLGISKQLLDEGQKSLERYQKENSSYQELLDEYNRKYAGKPIISVYSAVELYKEKINSQLATMKELEGRCNQITELIAAQNREIEKLVAEMKGLIQ